MFLLLLIFNVLDVLFTRYTLALGGTELNPFAELLITTGGYSLLLCFKVACILVLWGFLHKTKSRWIHNCARFATFGYGVLTIYHIWIVYMINY